MLSEGTWYVYIIRCQDKFLYTGIAKDVKKRVLTHRSGRGAKFTRNKNPIELVYVAKQEGLKEALITERSIKRYSRAKKELLIETFDKDSIFDKEIEEFFSVNVL